MSDTANTAVPNQPNPKVKSKRGRRILVFVLILLILLLGVAGYFLYRIISPTGGSADSDNTNGVTWVRSIYGINDTIQGSLERAQAAVSGSDGTIWVVDAIHNSLLRFTADGRFTGAVKGPDAAPLTIPGRFAIGPDGKFYVVETSLDKVRVITRDNAEEGSFGIPQPVSIAVSDDRIVVGAIPGFAILDKAGKPIKIVGSRGKGDDQFDYVHGVAIAEDGTIFVMDSYNNRLSAYDKDGKRLWIKRTGKPQNSATTNNLTTPLTVPEPQGDVLKGDQAMQLPLGITIDGAGRIIVIDMFEGSLSAFSPKDGAFIAKYGETGPEDGQFFYPVSVSYDKGRDWFTVADALNNRVQVIRLPDSAGSGGGAAAVRRGLAGPLRACLFPLLLLVVALIVWLVVRAIRKRNARDKAADGVDGVSTSAAGLPAGEDSVEIPPTE